MLLLLKDANSLTPVKESRGGADPVSLPLRWHQCPALAWGQRPGGSQELLRVMPALLW